MQMRVGDFSLGMAGVVAKYHPSCYASLLQVTYTIARFGPILTTSPRDNKAVFLHLEKL
jgi:hypothetical protein